MLGAWWSNEKGHSGSTGEPGHSWPCESQSSCSVVIFALGTQGYWKTNNSTRMQSSTLLQEDSIVSDRLLFVI